MVEESRVNTQSPNALDAAQIQAIIPHRPPFLLIDRIVELEPGKRIVGQKDVSLSGDDFLRGHFPDYPVMPGVLIVEALAQTGAVLVMQDPANAGKLPFFACSAARVRRSTSIWLIVSPRGEALMLSASQRTDFGSRWNVSATASRTSTARATRQSRQVPSSARVRPPNMNWTETRPRSGSDSSSNLSCPLANAFRSGTRYMPAASPMPN